MESSPLSPVRPIKPVAPYLGGKRNLASRLVPMIEEVPHHTYAEVFVGMMGVFLRRRLRPKFEIVNDFDLEVATFFRILQRHYIPFLEMFRFQLTTRAEFERLVAVDPRTLTDLEKAARFLYLQRIAFGGKRVGQNFGMDKARARFDVTRLQPMLEDLHERLAGVVIERMDFRHFIPRYDAEGVLFFLDPPYWGGEADYGEGLFCRADYEVLRDLLRGVQGRFIMTLNDRPEVRAIFEGFTFVEAEHTYRVSGAPTQAKELIITGPYRP